MGAILLAVILQIFSYSICSLINPAHSMSFLQWKGKWNWLSVWNQVIVTPFINSQIAPNEIKSETTLFLTSNRKIQVCQVSPPTLNINIWMKPMQIHCIWIFIFQESLRSMYQHFDQFCNQDPALLWDYRSLSWWSAVKRGLGNQIRSLTSLDAVGL